LDFVECLKRYGGLNNSECHSDNDSSQHQQSENEEKTEEDEVEEDETANSDKLSKKKNRNKHESNAMRRTSCTSSNIYQRPKSSSFMSQKNNSNQLAIHNSDQNEIDYIFLDSDEGFILLYLFLI
jgi:hypothetical protein